MVKKMSFSLAQRQCVALCGEPGHIRQNCPCKTSELSANSDVNDDDDQKDNSETTGTAAEGSSSSTQINETTVSNNTSQVTQDIPKGNDKNADIACNVTMLMNQLLVKLEEPLLMQTTQKIPMGLLMSCTMGVALLGKDLKTVRQ